MAFQTDDTWTPATYRKARAAWAANAPADDGPIFPRRARSARPRHAAMQREFRPLLTWRAMSNVHAWTELANDNEPQDEDAPASAARNPDSKNEIRPTVSEMLAAIEGVAVAEKGGRIIPVAGDMDRHDNGAIARLGRLHFSSGDHDDPRAVPTGGLTRIGAYRPRDVFRVLRPANDNVALSTASPGAIAFTDPVADASEALHVRAAIGEATAAILDHALTAASFREIGERLGFGGKYAERQGKQAVVNACKILEEKLTS